MVTINRPPPAPSPGREGWIWVVTPWSRHKSWQKKTNNLMRGRRLRHVNAKKKMKEWLTEEKERKLEKAAEDFIKKKAKTLKKAGGGDGAKKYRKDSAKCMEEVDKSIRTSLGGGFLKSKRKVVEATSGSKSKKLKIC